MLAGLETGKLLRSGQATELEIGNHLEGFLPIHRQSSTLQRTLHLATAPCSFVPLARFLLDPTVLASCGAICTDLGVGSQWFPKQITYSVL